jgi:hypothetical protein
MARKLWCVLVEDFDSLHPSDYYRDQYVFDSSDNLMLSVFTTERFARDAAQQLAIKHPGKDVHVFTPSYGYTAEPRPIESKVWTPDGKFIPGTPE